MTLKEFAENCGVKIVETGPEWEGKFGYVENGCIVSGYRTENSTYNGWLKNTFGTKAAKTIVKLLKESKEG